MSETAPLSLLDPALLYAARGWQVFPCHTPTSTGCSCRTACGTRAGKHPRTQHGLKDATTTEATIRRWWKQWPEANIGIAMGQVSGVVALDVDSYAGGDDSLEGLVRSYHPLPETVEQLTGGGGRQLLFTWPGRRLRNAVSELGQGLDIRGDGGYIIAPPSLHKTGIRYAWEVLHDPDDIAPAPFPVWLTALCESRQRTGASIDPGQPVAAGQRNDHLFKLGCAMRARGFPEVAILAALDAINAAQCRPPLDAEEVERIATSCAGYPAGTINNGTQRQPAQHGKEETQRPFDPFVFVDVATIMAKIYPPPRWLIRGLIADGLTILGGSPKSGKSYLAYALALATCRPALWCGEWHTDQGAVTFVSLEDDEADSFERIQQLCPGVAIPPGRLRFVHGSEHVPSFSEGFLGWVEEILKSHKPRLLVIDPVSYLYVLKRSTSQFEETKDMLFPLRWLGKLYGCAIVCVDHRRKRSRDDVSIFDTLHGSVAKQAVADALLMVERDESEITIAALVRKGKDQTLHLNLAFEEDRASLTHVGESQTKTSPYSTLRQQVYTVLAQSINPLGLRDIVTLLEIADSRATRETIRQILVRGYHSKEIDRTSRDQYLLIRKESA